MAFKILVIRTDGEGTQRHVPAPGHEHTVFHAIEEAAQVLFENFGHGLITTPEGEAVLPV